MRWANRASRRKQALRECADWLLTKEVRRKGDWSVKRPKTEPSGWYFEFANEFYPDIDDTAQVLLALSRSRRPRARPNSRPANAAPCNWLLAMQSKDGGWAAFDVDNNWQLLSFVPFADHNAMLDPTCPDITGRVLEALCAYGLDQSHPAVRRGIDYLMRSQEAGRQLVRTLGRRLHLRHIFGAARVASGRRERPRSVHPARAGMGARHSERRRRLGRKLRELRARNLRRRAQHSFANRVGRSWRCSPAAIPPAPACMTASIT